MATLELQGLTKRFGEFTAVDSMNLKAAEGEMIALLGGSGCGKTTTLRMIAGFTEPTAGQILVDGKNVSTIPPYRRNIGIFFQNYALFPHMTVFENVAFGLKLQKLPKNEIRERVEHMLALVKLTGMDKRYPRQLSGGQQQRVALARALVTRPSILLLDEPLSNLDAKLRLEMRYELQRLHVETGSTFVYVTHDQMEAMTLATQICLIENGVLQQYDAPLTVYHQPNNLFVADFVGNPSINFVEAKGAQRPDGAVDLTVFAGRKATFRPKENLDLNQWFLDRDARQAAQEAAHKEKAAQKSYVEKGNKDETFRYHIARVNDEDDGIHEEPMLTNEDLVLGIRPEFLSITGGGNVECEIYGAMPTGMESTVKVRIGEYLLTGVVFGSTLFTIGSKHLLDITGSSVMLFDRSSGRRITSGTLKLL